jgi:uncharacterized cupredoxin-like copper-binding protein
MLELVNAGQDEHNLEPGTYTLYCAIPAHEELGMKATFTVQ